MDVNNLKTKGQVETYINETVESINKLNKLKSCEEIIILACTDDGIESLNKAGVPGCFDDASLYFCGGEKEKLIEDALKYQEEYLNKLLTRLEEV